MLQVGNERIVYDESQEVSMQCPSLVLMRDEHAYFVLASGEV